jgi:hypothetical protein
VIVRTARDEHAQLVGYLAIVVTAPPVRDPLPRFNGIKSESDERLDLLGRQQWLAALEPRGMRQRGHAARAVYQLHGLRHRLGAWFGGREAE